MGQQVHENNDFPRRRLNQVDGDGGQRVALAGADKATAAGVELRPMGLANQRLAIARQKSIGEGF